MPHIDDVTNAFHEFFSAKMPQPRDYKAWFEANAERQRVLKVRLENLGLANLINWGEK